MTGTSPNDLSRSLKNRHIQLIAFGGAIGVGLFLGSASAIAQTGPAVLLAYAISGLMIFFVARALGEMLLYRPVAGSFTAYAEEFLGPWAGFATGWSFWFLLVVVSVAEITAVGIFLKFWFPALPQWIPALATLLVMLAVNLSAVRLYGEFEFWFALIKLITILALIVIGLAIILFGMTDLGATASVTNLWRAGFMPFGFKGLLFALPIVAFAFGGIELIGMTAGEAENPEITLPRAVNQVIRRIFLFYIAAMTVILCLVPWNQLDIRTSPFTLVFDRIGIPAAASLVNFVVITAAASSFNSGLYSAGRMLYSLAQSGSAPALFGRLNHRHVPAASLIFSAALMLVGVLFNYLLPAKVFNDVISIDLVVQLWTWAMILLAHVHYRRAVARGEVRAVAFRLPWSPVSNWVALAFLGLVAVLLCLNEETRIAFFVGPVWFALVTIGYRLARRVKPRA